MRGHFRYSWSRWGGTNTGGEDRYCFKSSNAFCCSCPQVKSLALLIITSGMNGSILPDRFDMNHLM